MKLVIFGLRISSSWGNGHAALGRGLCRALARASHRVVFFARGVPYHRRARDLEQLDGSELDSLLFPVDQPQLFDLRENGVRRQIGTRLG